MIAHRAVPQGDKETLVVIPESGKKMVLKCSYVEYVKGHIRYQEGRLIQDAFPTLSADEREFLKTGITPDEWEAIFGKED
jgi:hypothetical protein